MNFEHFAHKPNFFPYFPVWQGKMPSAWACAAIRGSGGLCAPIGLHAWRPGPMAEMGTGLRRVTRIAALLRPGVAAALDAQVVAEMRPQLLRPRGVRRLLPFG